MNKIQLSKPIIHVLYHPKFFNFYDYQTDFHLKTIPIYSDTYAYRVGRSIVVSAPDVISPYLQLIRHNIHVFLSHNHVRRVVTSLQ